MMKSNQRYDFYDIEEIHFSSLNDSMPMIAIKILCKACRHVSCDVNRIRRKGFYHIPYSLQHSRSYEAHKMSCRQR